MMVAATASQRRSCAFARVSDIRIEGAEAVTGITFRSGGNPASHRHRLVALHEGVIPAQQMPRSIGCAFAWDAAQRCFAPVLDAWGNSASMA